MANTYVKIATVSGTGSSGTLQFTSIPATYTDLLVKVSARNTSTNDYFEIRFNGVSTNLSGRALSGEGSGTPTSFSLVPYGRMNGSGTTASTFASTDIYIPNYAGATNKSVSTDSVSENNATLAFAVFSAGLWSNTAAITSIELVATGNNFATNSTATLYGILKN